MIDPAGCRIDKAVRIQLLHTIGQGELRVSIDKLAPALVVDDLQSLVSPIAWSSWHNTYPGYDAGEALELVHQKFQLALEFLLLLRVGQDRFQWPQGRHILDDKKTQFIARAVEQSRFHLDLWEC